jgi:hypothetical protein
MPAGRADTTISIAWMLKRRADAMVARSCEQVATACVEPLAALLSRMQRAGDQSEATRAAPVTNRFAVVISGWNSSRRRSQANQLRF